MLDQQKPTSLPFFIDILKSVDANTEKIILAIATYRDAVELPDHNLYPYEYIATLDYLEVIENFEKLIQNEYHIHSNSNQKGDAKETPEDQENKPGDLRSGDREPPAIGSE